MVCPRCGPAEARVLDSRLNPEGKRRRRLCLKCKRRYSTMEQPVQAAALAAIAALDDLIELLQARKAALQASVLAPEETSPDG